MGQVNAPEKIYYAPYGDMRENVPITDNDIEYTRTDAFIEKALKWINEHTSLCEKLVIENFRKYMEGENE